MVWAMVRLPKVRVFKTMPGSRVPDACALALARVKARLLNTQGVRLLTSSQFENRLGMCTENVITVKGSNFDVGRGRGLVRFSLLTPARHFA